MCQVKIKGAEGSQTCRCALEGHGVKIGCVGFFDHLVTLLDAMVMHTGAVAPIILLLASFIEYVFPPFPGDTVVLLGAWYAVHGSLSWPLAFGAVTAGAVAGTGVDWWVGRALGTSWERRAARSPRGWLSVAQLQRFEAAYRRYGGWLLAGNRFLPGVRGFIFLAAGAARVPLRKVLLLAAFSAALWNALLLALGALLARNLEELGAWLDRYTRSVSVVLAIGAAVLVLRAWARHRRKVQERST